MDDTSHSPLVCFRPCLRMTGSTSICSETWRGILHESRSTYRRLVYVARSPRYCHCARDLKAKIKYPGVFSDLLGIVPERVLDNEIASWCPHEAKHQTWPRYPIVMLSPLPSWPTSRSIRPRGSISAAERWPTARLVNTAQARPDRYFPRDKRDLVIF